MSLLIEKLYPFVLALIGGAIWWYFSLGLPEAEKEFFAAALSLGAVLAGFIATAQAILMALPVDSVMGRLRSSGYILELTSYLAHALYGSLIFCICNLAGFFLIDESKHCLPRYFSSLWIAFALFAFLAFLRVSNIMLKIMRFSARGSP